ncbi:MAG: phosphoribosylamine--glycine ligase [Gammaproteobacteria bacterium]|nr:phosphoribosylamine--glycine ligase [Gammaproteobacteria bacterium]MDH5344213.1 phosphoribosylamine--glycine ligase [Gammaproteobacteria bacterium]
MSKRFLFVSIDALISDIAWQVTREGNDVKYFIENETEKTIGDGLVPKVNNWEKHVKWADVIVFDDVLGQGEKAAKLRAEGKHVVGGTAYTDRLEDDRSFGQQELKKHGVSIIPFAEFTNFDTAIAYVREHPGAYVIKPSGEAQNIKRLLFVGQEDDGMDVIHVLQSYKAVYADTVKVFQLQRRMRGVEVAVGAFFNGSDFMMPININFEHKPLFPGDIGPATGEMGTCMYWSEPNKLFSATLAKLKDRLAEEGYVGYMDVNCIVNGNGIYPLEFTARFGYPTISIQSEGISMPMGEFLYGMASGTLRNFKTKRGFQIGLRVVVPPFPYDDPKTFAANSKDRVVIFRKPGHEGIHIEDIRVKNGEWLITGHTGVVLIVTGTGISVKQAQAQAYQRVKNILIPNMYYRTDIGDRWFEDHDRLHSWGYLRES